MARHSTPTLTDRYTHPELHDTGAAAAQLPPLMPTPADQKQAAAMKATGPDDTRPQDPPPGSEGPSALPTSFPQTSQKRRAASQSNVQIDTAAEMTNKTRGADENEELAGDDVPQTIKLPQLGATMHDVAQETKWRKCMGIEPTGHTRNVWPNGFEDRGHHQVCKHFR